MTWNQTTQAPSGAPPSEKGVSMDDLRALMEKGQRAKALEWLIALPCPEFIDPSTGETALHVLAAFDDLATFAQHLRRLPDPDLTDRIGQTAAHICAIHDRPEHIRCLKEAGADLNRKARDGTCPVHSATVHRSIAAIRALHAACADMSLANCCGDTAAHLAIDAAVCIQTLRAVLECGVDPNIQNMHGDTALHTAVEHDLVHAIPILHQFQAKTGIRNDKGLTPDLMPLHRDPDQQPRAAAMVLRERWARTLEHAERPGP